MAEKREIIGVNFEVFPDYVGERYNRSLYLGDTKETMVVKDKNGKDKTVHVPFDFKLETNIPVPATWEKMSKMFGLSDEELRRHCVKHLSTDRDTAVRNYINKVKHDTDWEGDTSKVTKKCTEIYQADLETAPERKVSKKAEKQKKMASTLAKLGITDIDAVTPEMIEEMAKKLNKKK